MAGAGAWDPATHVVLVASHGVTTYVSAFGAARDAVLAQAGGVWPKEACVRFDTKLNVPRAISAQVRVALQTQTVEVHGNALHITSCSRCLGFSMYGRKTCPFHRRESAMSSRAAREKRAASPPRAPVERIKRTTSELEGRTAPASTQDTDSDPAVASRMADADPGECRCCINPHQCPIGLFVSGHPPGAQFQQVRVSNAHTLCIAYCKPSRQGTRPFVPFARPRSTCARHMSKRLHPQGDIHKLVSARVGPRLHVARLRAHTQSLTSAPTRLSTMQSCCMSPLLPPMQSGRAFDRLACPWTCLECSHLRGCRCPSATARLWQNGSCHMQSDVHV
jgi:hypothetical protein